MDSKELWEKYCGFYRKSFDEQIKYNEELLKRHLSLWMYTYTGKDLCRGKIVKGIDDLPLTEYGDYTILGKVTEAIEYCEKKVSCWRK